MYDVDRDGFISNGELFLVLKMMVGSNLKVCANYLARQRACEAYICLWKDEQLQQIVDKTILEADQDGDGKLSFEEFAQMVSNTVSPSSLCLVRLPLKIGRWVLRTS